MFGTFRYSKTTQNYEHVKLSSDDNVDARGYTLVACDSCRARKLKCNGDRNRCDRCLASQSSACTYNDRKRPRQPSIISSAASSSPKPNQGNLQHLAEQEQFEEPTSSSASSVSTSRPSTFAPSPSASAHTIGPLPTLTCLYFPWKQTGNLTDLERSEQALMIPSSKASIDRSPPDNIQFPTPQSAWHNPNSHISPSTAAQMIQGIPQLDWDIELNLADQGPEQAGQMESRPALSPSLGSSQLASEEAHCTCLSIIIQLLEDMDVGMDTTGIDTLLMRLGRGIRTCSNMLACVHCNTCVDNAMLLASTAQQLVPTAKEVSIRFLLARRELQDPDTHSWTSCGFAESENIAITFGEYRIELPEMKALIFRKIVLLHLEGLQKLLSDIKERIGPMRAAWGLLVDAESKASEIFWVLQELSK